MSPPGNVVQMGSENVGLIIMKTDGGGGGELPSPTYRKSGRTGKISRGSSLQLAGNMSPSDWDRQPGGGATSALPA